MKTAKSPILLPLFLGASLVFTSCATHPPKATPVAAHRSSTPIASDGRNYDIHTEGWETLPPYAQLNNPAGRAE